MQWLSITQKYRNDGMARNVCLCSRQSHSRTKLVLVLAAYLTFALLLDMNKWEKADKVQPFCLPCKIKAFFLTFWHHLLIGIRSFALQGHFLKMPFTVNVTGETLVLNKNLASIK